jgi:hypothetical protein
MIDSQWDAAAGWLRRACGTNRKMFSHWEDRFPIEEIAKIARIAKKSKFQKSK